MDIKKDMFIERVLSIIELPYIKSLDSMGIDDENTQKLILSKLFNDDIVMYDGDEINIYNSNGNKIYYEDSEGYWVKYEYDSNGNQIYFENSNGEWYKYEYDSRGNKVYYEDSEGYWVKYEYDSNGNEIYYEDSDGEWSKYEYDSNGNKIYYEDSEGQWGKKEYDSNGNKISFVNSDGYWEKYEYDSNGNEIYYENSDGDIKDNRNTINESEDKKDVFVNKVLSIIELPYIKSLDSMGIDDGYTQELILSKLYNDNISIEYGDDYVDIYDSNGNEIYYEDYDGEWGKKEYDSNGNQIYFENSNGGWAKWEYDSNGNKVYYEDSEGEWDKWENDSNGNLIYYENSHGHWAKREYDSNGKEIYYENSNGVIIDNRNNINESEDKRDMFVERVLSIIELPYIKSLNSIGIDDIDTQELILSKLFNDDITINYRDDEDDLNIYNSKRNKVYYEDSEGYWVKYEYDPNGNLIYNENSEGDWFKKEYDSNGNQIYYEDNYGEWVKTEYDSNGNQIYYEDNYGEWFKWKYDSNGNQIYYEDNYGRIVDKRNNINESEDKRDMFVNRVLSMLELPYFRSLDNIGIDDENTQKLILSKLFSDDITIEYHDYDVRILDSSKNELYYEYPDGFWEKREHDSDGNLIYYEDSDGEWSKYEYDSNGNKIYYEDSNGKIIDRRNNINESEDKKDMFIDRVLSILDTPYIKSLNNMGIDVLDTQELILSRLFNDNVTIVYDGYYYDVHVYNSNGDKVYYEDSEGEWYKREYDSNRKRIYYENSNGDWSKAEYDSNGNEIYYEDNNGYWIKREYNTYGKQIYYEDSRGKIIDKREYK